MNNKSMDNKMEGNVGVTMAITKQEATAQTNLVEKILREIVRIIEK